MIAQLIEIDKRVVGDYQPFPIRAFNILIDQYRGGIGIQCHIVILRMIYKCEIALLHHVDLIHATYDMRGITNILRIQKVANLFQALWFGKFHDLRFSPLVPAVLLCFHALGIFT